MVSNEDEVSQAMLAAASGKSAPPKIDAVGAAMLNAASGKTEAATPATPRDMVDFLNPGFATAAGVGASIVNPMLGTAAKAAGRLAEWTPWGDKVDPDAWAQNVQIPLGHVASNVSDAIGDAQSLPGKLINKIPGAQTPAGQTALEIGGDVLAGASLYGAGKGLRGATPEPLPGNPQSISAAAASPNLTAAGPELREAVADAKANGPINNDVLTRHLEADSLPIPAQLSKGQATRDAFHYSEELNNRARVPGAEDFFSGQNQNLIDNLREFRENIVAPDVHSTDVAGHVDNVISAYKDIDKSAQGGIKSAYKALTDLNGGDFPIDAKTLLGQTQTALKQRLLTGHAPAAEMGELTRMSQEGMSFEDFENLRTNLATITRTAQDGNVRAAAGVMRDQLEQLPMKPGGDLLKSAADNARSLARTRFQSIDADPAYKAAIGYNDESPGTSISPERFAQRFVINGSRDQVALMRQNLAGDPVALQSMGAIGLEHLRTAARISPSYEGTFAADNFNRAWDALGPKQNSLFTPSQQEGLQTLANVARYEKTVPAGSHVNFSNTQTAALSSGAKDLAASGAEHLVNKGVASATGIPLVGTVGRMVGGSILKGRKARAFYEDHFSPGAGLEYPSAAGSP